MRRPGAGLAFHSQASGYLQRVHMDALQRIAAERKLRITLTVAPGALIVCSRPIGYGLPDGEALTRSAAALDFAPDLAQLRRRHADYWGPACLPGQAAPARAPLPRIPSCSQLAATTCYQVMQCACRARRFPA